MKRIQKKLKLEVYKRTNGQYRLDADQDDSDLLIAMRAVYFEEAKNLPDKVIHQVKILNDHVVERVTPEMITAIKQEYGYLKEINEPLKPMDRSINVNTGKITLPSITTIWEV